MFFPTFFISTSPVEADYFPFALLVVRDSWLYFVHIILDAKSSWHEIWAILKHHREKFKKHAYNFEGLLLFLWISCSFIIFPPNQPEMF